MQDMDDIRYCPICKAQLEPRIGYDGDDRQRLLADCPNHGSLEIEVTAATVARIHAPGAPDNTSKEFNRR